MDVDQKERGSGDEEEDTAEAAARRKQDTLALLRAKAQVRYVSCPLVHPFRSVISLWRAEADEGTEEKGSKART